MEIFIFSLNTRIRLIAGVRDSPLSGEPVQLRPAAVRGGRLRAQSGHATVPNIRLQWASCGLSPTAAISGWSSGPSRPLAWERQERPLGYITSTASSLRQHL